MGVKGALIETPKSHGGLQKGRIRQNNGSQWRSRAVGAVTGGFVTKVSGLEGVLCVVVGDSGGSGNHQWGTGSAGTWSGRVLVFDIPAKGPNIVLSEELAGHQTSVTDIATEPAQGQVSGFPLPIPVSLGAFPLW